MAKNKIYAVKKGHTTGIFNSWAECQAAISGFSGAEHKGFETEDEARAYLDDIDIIMENDIAPRLNAGKVVAFTDGSFDADKQAYGSGVCIFDPQGNSIELSSKGNNVKYVDLRNIAGEIIAVLNAVDWAWKNGYEQMTVFYDYEGIGKWASGEWKANKSLSKFYKQYIDDKEEIISIEFVKVSGHSNNQYNDRADALAKSAIFENKVIRDFGGNSGYIISPVNAEAINSLLEKIKGEYCGLDYSTDFSVTRKSWKVTFNSDRVQISLYNNIKMTVQGKKSDLFQMITTSVIENLPCDDFVQVLKDAYSISVNKVKVEDDYKRMLPTISQETLPENVVILIKQSIINLNNPAFNDIEFSGYAFPALKALEAVLKYNLDKCGIPMTSPNFNMFDKNNNVFTLQPSKATGLSPSNVVKLENCYNHLYNQRHTLFHFGIIIGGTDTNTRLLNKKSDANDIINNALKIIDENYIV